MQEDRHEEIIKGLTNITKRLDTLNGSVLSLKLWRAYITGAVAVIVLLGLPILGYVAIQVISQGNEIARVIGQTRSISK